MEFKKKGEEFTGKNTGDTILIISKDSPESYSSAGERIRHMALASGSVFDKALVLSLVSHPKRVPKKGNSKIVIHEIRLSRESPYPIIAYFDPLKFVLLFIYTFFFSLRYKPTHILVSMPPSEVGVSAWLVAKFLGMNLIVDLRDDWESAVERQLSDCVPSGLLRALFWLASKVYLFSATILVATQTIGDRVKERGINTPTILAPNGADTSIFFPRCRDSRKKIRAKYALPLDKVIILYCGDGMTPYYRLDYLLSSVVSLPKDVKKSVFVVFYLYKGIENIERMKEELGISDDLVEVRGPVPRAILAEIMASCDVGLVPFDDEPYLLCARSAKLYEYLSAGLYVFSHGPEDGELDRFFSLSPQLGKFSLPHSKDSFNAFFRRIQKEIHIFDDDSRFARHKFILENYDRRATMTKVMRLIRSLPVSASR